MKTGNKGIGSKKHGRSGHAPHSPKFLHQRKLEAERTSIKDNSRIKNPKSTINELFNKRT